MVAALLVVAAHMATPDSSQWSANSILDPNTGKTLEYRQLIRSPNRKEWLQSTANELGQRGCTRHLAAHDYPHGYLLLGHQAHQRP
jgi:hypothetical protein